MDSDLLRNEQDDDDAHVFRPRGARATKHEYALDEFVVDTDDDTGSSESEDNGVGNISDDGAAIVSAADADDVVTLEDVVLEDVDDSIIDLSGFDDDEDED